MGVKEILDKIFGGGESRGLKQGVILLIAGIVLIIVAYIMIISATFGSMFGFLALFTGGGDTTLITALMLGIIAPILDWIGVISIIIGGFGLLWYYLRSRDKI